MNIKHKNNVWMTFGGQQKGKLKIIPDNYWINDGLNDFIPISLKSSLKYLLGCH
jgi:hypothetical protein